MVWNRTINYIDWLIDFRSRGSTTDVEENATLEQPAGTPREGNVRTFCPKIGHPVQSSDILFNVLTHCPKFGHSVQSSDTLSKVRTFCPKFGHPVQSSDTLSKVLKLCTKFGHSVQSSNTVQTSDILADPLRFMLSFLINYRIYQNYLSSSICWLIEGQVIIHGWQPEYSPKKNT